jgi:N-acetylglucosaminyl-diphospho-decaprenol L-rhamnosyltransferase
MISVSVVSHNQGSIADILLADLAALVDTTDLEIILTNNVADGYTYNNLPGNCAVKIINNAAPQGFGHNHNQAFTVASGEWFCVLNPDIRLPTNPFLVLVAELEAQLGGVVAPSVLSPERAIEDSVRRFPTPFSLLRRLLGFGDGSYHYALDTASFDVDWAAGMFLLFRADIFRTLKGFDQGFFLYCEDIDICARIWKAGCSVQICPLVNVIHDAQRASRRNFKYLRWHLGSYLRYFIKHMGRLPR